MNLSIRASRSSDFAAVDDLCSRAFPRLLKGSYPPSVLVTAVPLMARANSNLVGQSSYFVVEDPSSRILAVGGWTDWDPATGKAGAPSTGHIRHFATDPAKVRQGLGRMLMGHIVDHARAAGITRLDCTSTLMALPFYQACGFEHLRDALIALRPGVEIDVALLQREV